VSKLSSTLSVSRSGFHAWLIRKPSQRALDDERIGAVARASFLASDRTYGARRVWHDVLASGVDCGLHKIEGQCVGQRRDGELLLIAEDRAPCQQDLPYPRRRSGRWTHQIDPQGPP
jgi:hypothetical protein